MERKDLLGDNNELDGYHLKLLYDLFKFIGGESDNILRIQYLQVKHL